ncbi:MAG: hypothetical protein PHV16_04095 [Candidatus Nanoarchaeia archaeon]|nr:hypothetical protein [Candidatus Nanoarchaeia archaeon]
MEEKKEVPEENLTEQNEEENSSGSGKFLIIAVIAIVGLTILFFSIRYLYQPKPIENNYEYNGFTFTKIEGYGVWFTEIQKQDKNFRVSMRYSPMEVEDIPIDRTAYQVILNSNELYLTVPNNLSSIAVLALAEVGRITGTQYGILDIPSTGALTHSKGDETPVKNCEDAVGGTGIILFNLGNYTRVYLEGKCVIVEGETDWDIVRAADRLTFGLLGIMD